ncbi:MAG: hypothetical protein GYB64_03790 [Chloroflexi bacterium]|nr:hypothetical protein [Chloroflexota bacterium]
MWNTVKRYLDLRWIAFWYVLPLVAMAAFVLFTVTATRDRFDEEYFSQAMQAEYSSPSAVLANIEAFAKDQSNEQLLADLQGRSDPAPIAVHPEMELHGLMTVSTGLRTFSRVDLEPERWDTIRENGRFFSYMYRVPDVPVRHSFILEQAEGRWVLTTQDAYYALHSGRWLSNAVPAALLYWLILTVVLAAIWFSRNSKDLNNEMFPHTVPQQESSPT